MVDNKFEALYEAAIAEAKKNRELNESPERWSIGDSVVVQSRALMAAGLSQYNNRPGVITEAKPRRNGPTRYTIVIETGADPSKYREIFAEESDLRSMEDAPKKIAHSDEEYEAITDRKGNLLHPGDRVRIKLYPRGTLEGTVTVNPRVRVVRSDGSTTRALSVKDEVDGTLYELKSKGALKL